MANIKLDSKEVDEIKGLARRKLIEYSKLNNVIGGQIFNILELENKVLYYPVEDEEVWGFSEKVKGKSFVWINTAIAYDKQVFAAAHELYHLWFENDGEIILKANMEEISAFNISESELRANRFAAEFLINEELLLQEVRTYVVNELKQKGFVTFPELYKMADDFEVSISALTNKIKSLGLLYIQKGKIYLSKDEATGQLKFC